MYLLIWLFLLPLQIAEWLITEAQIKHWQLERKILQLKDELKAEVENIFHQSSI